MGFEKYTAHGDIALAITKKIKSIKKKDALYKPFVFMAKDSKAELKKLMLENKIDADYDIVVSVGEGISKLLKKVYKEIGNKKTFFIGVADPVGCGLVKSLEHPGGCFTGVNMAPPSYEQYAELLKVIQPYISKILIPHNPNDLNGFIKKDTATLSKALEAVGFSVTPIEVSTTKETLKAIEKNIEQAHAIQFMDCSASLAEGSAAYVCALTQRLLLSGNGYHGITQGAAMSYGCKSDVLVPSLVEMIESYWYDRNSIESMAVITLPDQRVIFVNRFMLPWLPQEIMHNILTHKNMKVQFYWANCPVQQELQEDDQTRKVPKWKEKEKAPPQKSTS